MPKFGSPRTELKRPLNEVYTFIFLALLYTLTNIKIVATLKIRIPNQNIFDIHIMNAGGSYTMLCRIHQKINLLNSLYKPQYKQKYLQCMLYAVNYLQFRFLK